jgi:hypothetical protein
MEYKFKKFEGRNSRTEDRITITKSHTIGFPTKFYRDNSIGQYKFVVLFWDKEKKAIAVQFSNSEEEKSKFKILHNEGYGGSVVARSFFRVNDIDPEKYHGRYDWKKENIEGIGEIFVVELKEKVA